MKRQKIPAVMALITLILLVCTGCVVETLVPEVKEGYFDISVTYEINGEERTYQGRYVCSYLGVSTSVYGSSLLWDGYVLNTDKSTVVAIENTYDGGVIYADFGFYPEYLMSDPNYFGDTPKVYLYVEFVVDETGEFIIINDEQELFEKYGVKLISYYYDEPIKNSYETQWVLSELDPSIN